MTAISSSSGKRSSSKSSPWRKLDSGELYWDDLDARQKSEVVRHYAPKIKIIGLRLKTKLPKSVELSELISAGSMGLVEALMKFDPSLGIKFETYAENRIKGAMLDELRRMDWFSRSLRQKLRQIEEAVRKIESKSGQPAQIEEISDETGFTPAEVESGLDVLHNQVCVSLDAISENLASIKQAQQDNDPYNKAAFKEIVDKIADLINELTPREQLVLSLYYGEELNMRETAEVMDITEGRVSQLHSQALKKLRTMFKAQHGVQSV